jgi:tripartite-type tricarboxylate transporter receptor subunit TctC
MSCPWRARRDPSSGSRFSSLKAEFVKAANSPELIAALATQGTSPTSNSPEAFAKLIGEEQKRFAKIVRDSGAKAD